MSAAACAPTRLGTTLAFPARVPPSPAPEARGAAEPEPEPKRCVHPELWRACAGSMCTVPPVGAAVYYFPQGHAEHAGAAVALRDARVPPSVPCRVAAVRLMAEPGTDDVFTRLRLVPLRPWEPVEDVGEAFLMSEGGAEDSHHHHQQQQHPPRPRPLSFAKTLTESDANNGGGFSVPRFCALTIFPPLDYSFEPPVQSISAWDVHGVQWTFRHIYRGTPRRHLLTTGWSNFLHKKKLRDGDSVVFVRDDDGKIHIGVRRAKRRRKGDGSAAPLPGSDAHGRLLRGNAGGPAPSDGKVPAEDVVAAARLAGAGEPFDVVHYPGTSAPEFCVRAAAVSESMQVPWCPGLRFKMAFQTEDLSRISWFMGTVAGVEEADPARWPQSPWRLLQVTWDEPELLQNVNRVCPWQVEQVSSMPDLPRISPPPRKIKKPRTSPYTESHSECRLLFDPAAFPPNQPTLPLPWAPPHPAPNHHRNRHPSFPFPDGIAAGAVSAGIQGARHPQFAPFFSDLHLSNLPQSPLFCGIRPADHQAPPSPRIATDLKIGCPTTLSPSSEAKKGDDVKPPGITLFGRAILTEEQMKSSNGSGVPTSPRTTRSSSCKPGCDDDKASNTSDRSGSGVTHGSLTKKSPPPSWRLWWSGVDSPPFEFALEPGQCKVFVESDAVGRNLDLSALGSFEELCASLSGMFGIDNADLRSRMVYRTIAGEVKHVGDEPFSAFVKSARRITILSDTGSDNTGN